MLNASVTASNNDGQIVTLISGGNIKQMNGGVVADELTGSSVGNALLQDVANSVGTLEAFQAGGFFDLQTGFSTGRSLTVAGTDVSNLHFTGVTAGSSNTTGSLFIGDGGTLTLASNVTAESAGGSQAVGLEGQSISQTGGVITANSLSAVGLSGSVTLDQANQVGVLTGSFAEGNFSFTDAQALVVNNTNPFGLSVNGVTAGYNNIIPGNLTLTTTGTGNGMTLAGNLTASNGHGEIVTLVSAGGISEDLGNGIITADELTGSSVGDARLKANFNYVGTLEAFRATGNFTLSDAQALAVVGADVSTLGFTGVTAGYGNTTGNIVIGANGALTLAGNLNASSGNAQIVELVSASGAINQTGGAITADELTGSSVGDTSLTQTSNQVTTLEAFRAGGNFTLTDAQTLTVAGADVSSVGFTGVTAGHGNTIGNLTLKTTSGDIDINGTLTASSGNTQIVTLVSAGAIAQGTGSVISADELTGSSVNGTTLNGANLIGTLEAFRAGGNLSLTDAEALTVAGNDVSGLGLTGVTAGYGNMTGDLTLTTTGSGNGITLSGNLTAESTGGSQTVDLISADNILQTGGIINANTLMGSATGLTGSVALNDANTIGTLNGFTSGFFDLTDNQALTVSGTLHAVDTVLTTITGGITVTGTISGHSLSFSSAGGIDESAGTIATSLLGGSSVLDAKFTGTNTIPRLLAFTVTSGDFTLDDNSPLLVAGNVKASGNVYLESSNASGITTDPGITLASTGNGLVSIQADALKFFAGVTIAGSTFQYAPDTIGNTVTLGSTATDFNNATLNVTNVQIGAITEPGASSPTTRAGAITITSDQPFGGDNLDFETTGAVTGTAGGITGVGELTGNAASVSLSDTSNSIHSLGNFSTTGDFTLADNTGLSITGALNAGTHTVDFELGSNTLDENGGTGTITAGTLTGNSGAATLTGANAIPVLGNFDTHNGNFTLNDDPALTITGALNAGTGTVDLELGTFAVDEDGGAGSITAGELTGNSGAATLTGANAIATLGNYNTHNGAFTLDNTVNLSISGTLNAGTGTVDLELGTNTVDENSGAGVIEAAELTGNSGAATFSGANVIPVLGDYNSHNGNFTLDDTVNLSIHGTLNAGVSQVKLELGSNTVDENGGTGVIDADEFTGTMGGATLTGANNIRAVHNIGDSGDFTLIDDTALTIFNTIQGQTVSLTDTGGGIDGTAAEIDATTLTGSTTGVANFGNVNQIGTLAGFTNTSGAFTIADNIALAVTGTLNATGQTVTFYEFGSGIDAHAGVIEAATLTGGNSGTALFTDASNKIGAIENFTNNSGDFSLTDSVALTINGTLDVTGHTLTLNDTGGDIDAGTGTVDAATLTGSSAGNVLFTGATNTIGTLNGFTNTSGDFSLTDNAPLAITGTLNATGHTVTLNDTAGGIDASAGVIEANELTGSSTGQALFTDTSNDINTLGSFSNNSGQFSLTDTVALTVTGTLDASNQALTFTDTGGGVDASAATIDAEVLQGSTQGAALFTNASNQIGAVGFFTNTSGDFSLTDNTPLVIGATLDATGQTVTLIDTAGGIDGSVGQIEAATLTSSSTGDATFTDASNVIGTLKNSGSSANFSLTDTTPLTITGGLSGQTVTLVDMGGGIDASTALINASTLTGSTTGDASFTGGFNDIHTLGSFTNTSGSFTLNDDVPFSSPGAPGLTIVGTLNATGQTVTLNVLGGGIVASGAVIDAGTLTGEIGGNTFFTNPANRIDTLGGFLDTTGTVTSHYFFSLNDSVPLTINGELVMQQYTLTLNDTGGGIDESNGAILAAALTGSTAGDADFADAGNHTGVANHIGVLENFTNTSGAFSLTNYGGIIIAGTLNATGQTVTLVDEHGGIDASTGEIEAATLTGSTAGNAVFTDASNAIGTLNGFANTSGDFSLTDDEALTINGTLNATGHTVTLDVNGGINANSGVIDAATLTGSTAGDTFFANPQNNIGTLGSFTDTSSTPTQYSFTLTDSAPLTISGTLALAKDAVTLNVGGSIEASGGQIEASGITANASGTIDFTNAGNQIGTLVSLNDGGGFVSLVDNTPLAIGRLNAPGQTVSLVDTAGGIDESTGVITAAVLTGSTTGVAKFTGATNAIGTLGNFTNTSGAFSLTDSIPLTITGTLNATGQTVTLVDTGGGIDASNGVIDAAVLTGSTTGSADFSNPSNAIGTFTGFTNNSGSVSLTDTLALTLTGTIGAAGQTVTLNDTGGGIDASGAVIDAATLTGSTTGAALFTDASNQIGALTGFTNTSGAFSLTDTTPLTITGTLNATGQTVTLTETGGGLDANHGAIDAATLTGSTTGAATFTDAANVVDTLNNFTNTNGAFSLTDSTALTVTGTLNAAGQTVTLNDTGGGIDASAGQIIASTLTGSANGDALFSDSANQIGTFANFTDDAGSVSLTDSIFLTLTGTLDPTTVTLVDTGGGIDGSGAAIIADTLTGSTTGGATFTNAGNDIGTLNDFTNTSGAFSLTDSVALKITGTLNAAGQTVTLVDTGGGINASQGVIDAATLTGSTTGAATFTDATNAIGTLNGFTNASGNFSLTDSTALAMTATLDAAGQTVTLVDTGGAIDASHGVIEAATLTGSTAGNAIFTANNTIGVLDAFQAGGSLSLTDAEALAINGADISGLGFTGVSAGKAATNNLTVAVTGNLTLASNIATGGTLTLSSSGNVALNSGAITAATVDITAADNYTQANGTITGTTLASITATSGNLIINGGSISGATVDLTADQNILIGEQAFTTLALNDAPGSIDQIKDPILPVTVGAGGGFYEASTAYQNHVFVTTQSLNLTAPLRIVSENTGTLPESGGGYAPNGIIINQQTTPLPTAISIDGGPGSGGRPQVADLFAVLMQGTSVIGAEDVADSARSSSVPTRRRTTPMRSTAVSFTTSTRARSSASRSSRWIRTSRPIWSSFPAAIRTKTNST